MRRVLVAFSCAVAIVIPPSVSVYTLFLGQTAKISAAAPRRVAVLASTVARYSGPNVDDVVDQADTAARLAAEEAARIAAEQAAQAAAALAAAQAATAARKAPAPVQRPTSWAPPSDGWWDRVAVCEQGGWGTHTHAANWLATFVGDLGIMEQAWNENAPAGFPPGWVASREQQIIVANAIYAWAGPGAWGSGACTGSPF